MQSIADGAICNVSRLEFGVHTGTHIDAPSHFIEGAPPSNQAPLDGVGPALVIDATALASHITAEDIGRMPIASGIERVLVKTANSALWSRTTFPISLRSSQRLRRRW